MKKNAARLFFLSLLISLPALAQNTAWVKQGKAPKNDYGTGITRDNNGNIYITGTFQDSVRFDTILLTASFGDYCAKYDTLGNLVWAKENMGGSGVVFDGNSHLYMYKNGGTSVQKVDLNGAIAWSTTLFTSSVFGSNGIQDIYVQGTNFYATGYYSGDAYFGNDTLYNVTPANYGWDIFIAAFTSSGQNLWATTAGGNGLDKGYSLYVNGANEIYATGYFRDTAMFGATQVIGNGAQDMYLARYTSGGNLAWINTFGGTGFDLAAELVVGDNGNLYVTGRYTTSIVFGNDTLYANNMDAFVAKFDTTGAPLWAKGISGQGNDEEAGIAYENGKLAFMATTNGNVQMDSISANAPGQLDICIGELDTAGNGLWMKLYGGATSDEGGGLVLLNGSIYFTGNFNTTANFDSYQLTSQGMWDVVTGKIGDQLTTALVPVPVNSNTVEIYPNPFRSTATVCFTGYEGQAGVQLVILDLTGKEVKRLPVTAARMVLDREGLTPGLYLLRVVGENGVQAAGKFIVH